MAKLKLPNIDDVVAISILSGGDITVFQMG